LPITKGSEDYNEAVRQKENWNSLYSDVYLKDLYNKYEWYYAKNNIDSGNQKESAGTNENMFRAIWAFTCTKENMWHDICPLDTDYNHIFNANALKRIWSYFTFCNPPYDKSLLFLIKAAIEWKRGCNIVLILH
jgi:hypothetical protein